MVHDLPTSQRADTAPTALSDRGIKKVVVALSGGVDSSVAAWRLQQQGYQVEALFMKNWEEDDNENYCAAAADLADAQAVCDHLAIPLHTVNFAAEYWDQVFERFLAGYRRGHTPNPDILCNKEIKFTTFLQFAIQQLKADAIATGHYVRRQRVKGRYQLLCGLDHQKDQSYFLYTLDQAQIARSLFPLGELEKSTVRSIARQLGLVTAEKKDSVGICFIGQRRFRDFLARYLPAEPGNIESTEGQLLGRHPGLIYYTLGQRQGLGIGGTQPSQPYPWYVVEKDKARNVLVVAAGQHHPQQQAIGLFADQFHWIHPQRPATPLSCDLKIRYRQQAFSGSLVHLECDRITVSFEQPQIAVTPGQSVVFYQQDICLGGAVITERIPH